MTFTSQFGPRWSPYRYWSWRARRFGVRSALNLGHKEEEIEAVTTMQKEALFPLLRERLKQKDKRLLDFGCGPGRFTGDLAALIGGSVVGIDPIQRLLDLAPKAEHVEYRKLTRGVISADDEFFDVVWICLVLGGILDGGELRHSVNEIGRVLKPGGLLFLVENTTETPDSAYWKFRSIEEYRNLFPFAALSLVSEYSDLGERMSVLAGRKDE